MTEILLVCDENGLFKSLSASGHAGFSTKGKDIVCAAVTSLLRTTAKVLEETGGIQLSETNFSERGNLAFCVHQTDSSDLVTERLKCTASFVRNGLILLQNEYPEHLILRELKN